MSTTKTPKAGPNRLARTLAQPTHSRVQVLEVVSIPTYAFTGLIPVAIGVAVPASTAQRGTTPVAKIDYTTTDFGHEAAQQLHLLLFVGRP